MEHFTKTGSEADEDKKQKWDISVRGGSKIRNVISQALRLLQKEEKIVLTGTGPTVTRAITCAEIVKRKVKNLHQNNKLFYSRMVDIWEPKEDKELDKLQVTRRVPSISITLSTAPLPPDEPGYQAPGLSKSPVQFGKEDLALAIEEENNNRKANQAKQRKFTDGGRGHKDVKRGGHRGESSQTQTKGSRYKKSHKLGGQGEEAMEERKSETKNFDQLAGSARGNKNKRGSHHGGSKRQHSHEKKQKRDAPAEERTQTANPPQSLLE